MNAETSSLRLFQAGSESQPQPKDGGAHARRRALFGQPLLLEGEDGAAYDELLARIWAAVEPADIIDEMFTVDVVSLEWEVLRWRRLKLSMIRKCAIEKLEGFLREELHYHLYRDYFVGDLADILEGNLPKEQANFARTLAQQCGRNEKAAVDKVNKILDIAGLHMDNLLDGARDRKVKELVQAYAQREPDAATLIDELLSRAGKSIDVLMAEALTWTLDNVERVDRLTTIAEGRRNASLREIDRRRPVLAETLRRNVQQIESDELKGIETTPAKGETAA
jgi:hypothetical protein